MSTSTRTRRARLLSAAGAVLLAAGVIAIVIAVRAQRSAPQPPASAASPVNVIPHTSSPGRTSPTHSSASTVTPAPAPKAKTSAPATRGPILPRSAPVRLRIPAINVNSGLKHIGLDDHGEIVTPPLVRDSHAYWLTVSPTPGQLGPATILGHVDSAAYGPGVFFKLGDMRQRDKIYVTRSDGTSAIFEVQRVVEYSKANFPTHKVYGNIDHAGLRLITCGGTFDQAIGSYESNIVVYAALVSAHRS